jgi:5-hydroxyisourate hydrolase
MSLTTHVLDLTSGRPAAGLRVELRSLDDPAAPVVRVVTNADGRTDEPLLAGDHLAPGRYELTFAAGDYFGTEPGSLSYLDIVPVRFGIAPGTDRLHVALLVTPWSYTTYRGS